MKIPAFLLLAFFALAPAWAAESNETVEEDKTLIWPDGTRYVGRVENGKRSGKGTIFWNDGTRFVGTFKDDQRDGPGTMILTDGTVYNGYFKNDKLIEAPIESAAPEANIVDTTMPANLPPAPRGRSDDDTTALESAITAVMSPPPQPAIPGELPVTSMSNAVKSALTSAVDGWAAAWSAQDVAGYLSFYANEFKVPGRQSRKNWEGTRRSRLTRPQSIAVKVVYEKFEIVAPDVAEVSFRQTYSSDVYSDVTTKVLKLKKGKSSWQIIEEKSL